MRQTVIGGIRALAATIACVVLWLAEAHAQVAYSWYPTRAGCQVWGDEYDFGPGFTWTGKCNASNHIEGNGALVYYSDEGKKNVEFVGDFVDGRPNGPFQYNAFVGDDAWPSPYHKIRFDMGCRVSESRPEADPACRAASKVGKAAAAPAAAAPAKVAAPVGSFESNLKTFDAEQLLALVQRQLAAGNIDLANIVRSALLQRFPDSPAVPVVAKLIADAASAKQATTASDNTSNGSRPAGQAVQAGQAGQRIRIANLSQLIDAFAKIGITMKPLAGTPNGAVDADNTFVAYTSDCRADTCRAIQFLAEYRFATLPTYNLVQSWNLDKLYGRAYISGDRVKFDMVLRIPEDGMDVKMLEDFTAVYKTVANSFYNMVKPQ